MSSRTGYTSVNINDHTSNFIEIEDRATVPSIVQFDLNSSVIWWVFGSFLGEFFGNSTYFLFSTSYSGCLLYKNDDKLSTISIAFDELPINIASLHPWFIASTSVGLLIFAPDHETSLLQKIPVQSIHSMSTCHDLIFCGKFQG